MPPPGDLPDPGMESASLMSPALASGFFTTRATWEAHTASLIMLIINLLKNVCCSISMRYVIISNHDSKFVTA